MLKIAVDAMGGDNAPLAIVKGAVRAANEIKADILLVGDETQINDILKGENYPKDKIQVVHASEVITNHDKPTTAIRTKKDSSLVKCFDQVMEGSADAVVSAGSTGALLLAGIHIAGRIKGILRPALAAVLPNGGKGVLLIDTGANANCKPEQLVQFGFMGSIYAQKVMGIENPRVGLLNNGSEEGKGNLLVKAVYEPLANSGLNFIGNIEGRDVLFGDVDVLVCDGFSGNILLKSIEGTGAVIFGYMKKVMKQSIFTKLGALFMKKGLYALKKRFDYTEQGGAPFLGVTKGVFKAHGSADAKCIFNTIKQADAFAKSGTVEKIAEEIEKCEYFKENKAEE